MNGARRLAFRLTALLALAVLIAAAPAAAVARDHTVTAAAQTTEATGTGTSETNTGAGEPGTSGADTSGTDTTGTGTTGDEVTAGEDDDDNDALVAIAVLIFGALVLAMALLYLDRWRESTADLMKATLAKTGRLPDTDFVGAGVADEGARRIDAPAPVIVRGPPLVQVGVAAQFTASRDGNPVSAQWSVDPSDAGSAEPANAEATTVTPAKPGPLTVRATVGTVVGEAHPVAVPPSGDAGRVPLLGVGYGGVTISIFALTLAGAATVYGKLDGSALVALAGAFVGYFFVHARGQQADAAGDAGSGAAGETQQQD